MYIQFLDASQHSTRRTDPQPTNTPAHQPVYVGHSKAMTGAAGGGP